MAEDVNSADMEDEMFGTKNPIRRFLGRALYGAGHWLIHGRSAWDEPCRERWSFAPGDVDPQQIATEAARLTRAALRGDFKSDPLFGDRHLPTTNFKHWLRSKADPNHKEAGNG